MVMMFMYHYMFDNYLDLGKLRLVFLWFILKLVSIFIVGINQSLYGKQLVIQLVFRIVLSIWHQKYLEVKDKAT